VLSLVFEILTIEAALFNLKFMCVEHPFPGDDTSSTLPLKVSARLIILVIPRPFRLE
jgi:hypothetical protein